MSTRFYFDSAAAGEVTPDSVSADWGHINQAIVRRLNTVKQLSALAGGLSSYDAADHLVDGNSLLYRGVSASLAAQVIPSQTIKIQILAGEANANNNLFLAWKVFLINSVGVVGDTIVAFQRDGNEMLTLPTSRGDSATSTEATANAGDRICIELGGGGLPVAAAGVNGHDCALRVGDTGGDLPEGDDTVGDDRPGWLEFANSLGFQGVRSQAVVILS